MSRNQTLRETLPRLGFLRRAVYRFMPGEDIQDALHAAQQLGSSGFPTVVTHLGENLLRESEAIDVAAHYIKVLGLIQERKLDCHVSVKLTQLGLDFSEELCRDHLETIVRSAAEFRNMVWVDMEGSQYVDRTLRVFLAIQQSHKNIGLCLQSYLRRTGADIRTILSTGASIRIVKGAYAEPSNMVFASKSDVDKNFYQFALLLLRSLNGRDATIGIATHDRKLIRQINRSAAAEHIGKGLFEIQMLYGIQRETQQQLLAEGFRVRILISYGSFWFPWYMRRLAERPANLLFVLRQLFKR